MRAGARTARDAGPSRERHDMTSKSRDLTYRPDLRARRRTAAAPLNLTVPTSRDRASASKGECSVAISAAVKAAREFHAAFIAAEDTRRAAMDALFRLPAWWFICNPREPDAVYVRSVKGTRATLAFTSGKRALAAWDRFRLPTDPNGSKLLLSIAPADAPGWLHGFREHGVQHVAFNATRAPLIVPFAMIGDPQAASDAQAK